MYRDIGGPTFPFIIPVGRLLISVECRFFVTLRHFVAFPPHFHTLRHTTPHDCFDLNPHPKVSRYYVIAHWNFLSHFLFFFSERVVLSRTSWDSFVFFLGNSPVFKRKSKRNFEANTKCILLSGSQCFSTGQIVLKSLPLQNTFLFYTNTELNTHTHIDYIRQTIVHVYILFFFPFSMDLI